MFIYYDVIESKLRKYYRITKCVSGNTRKNIFEMRNSQILKRYLLSKLGIIYMQQTYNINHLRCIRNIIDIKSLHLVCGRKNDAFHSLNNIFLRFFSF